MSTLQLAAFDKFDEAARSANDHVWLRLELIDLSIRCRATDQQYGTYGTRYV